MKQLAFRILLCGIGICFWARTQGQCELPAQTRSLLPNPSFERYSADNPGCLSGQPGGQPDAVTQADCLEGWQQASLGTTDAWNLVTFPGGVPNFPDRAPLPYPDGVGVAGFWVGVSDIDDLVEADGNPPDYYREYLSACLVNGQRVDPAQDYRLSFDLGFVREQVYGGGDSIVRSAPSVELTLYGIRDCSDLFFASNECPEDGGATGWEPISTFTVSGNPDTWTTTNVDFSPGANYQAVALGGSCAADDIPPGFVYWRNYYFVDRMILNVIEAFEPPRAGPVSVSFDDICTGPALLTVGNNAPGGNSFQWFRNGQLIQDATGETLFVSDDYSGSYTVQVTNGGGCAESDPVTLIAPVIPDQYPSTFQICSENSEYQLNPAQLGNYSYLWDDGSTNPVRFVPRATATYTVTVTGECGENVETISTTADDPDVSLRVFPENPCPGDRVTVQIETDDDIFSISATGPEGPVRSSIVRSYGFTMPASGNAMTAINYSSYCTDGTVNVTLNSPPPYSPQAAVQNASCERVLGSITLTVADPSETTFSWTDSEGNPVGNNAATLEAPMGSYTVFISGSGSRCPASFTYDLDFENSISALVLPRNNDCANDASGSASVVSSQGVAPYVADWFQTDNDSLLKENSDIIDDLPAGNYYVDLTDATGCTVRTPFMITEPPPLTASFQPLFADCGITETVSVRVDAVGGTPPYTYVRNGTGSQTSNVFEVGEGEFAVLVSDQSGCEVRTDTLNIQLPTPYELDAGQGGRITLGDSLRLSALVSDPSLPIDSIRWFPGTGLSCTDCLDPTAAPAETTEYTIRTVSEEGCLREDDVLIIVDSAVDLYIPNAFSPNGDGVNDEWQIYPGTGFDRIVELNVYNRWGALIWSADTSEEVPRWDGRFDEEPLNPSVFVYSGIVRYLNGREIVVSGDIVLVR